MAWRNSKIYTEFASNFSEIREYSEYNQLIGFWSVKIDYIERKIIWRSSDEFSKEHITDLENDEKVIRKKTE